MVNASSLPARILANIVIWGILFLGAFFLLTFKDYTIGFELAVLSLGKRHSLRNSHRKYSLTPTALALGQIGRQFIAFQWIFAVVICGCLVVLTLIVGVPGMFGSAQQKTIEQHHIVAEDRERAPLLDDQ